MTRLWNSGVVVRTAHSLSSQAFLRLRYDVNAFYFGVLRRVAKGNTVGVTMGGVERQ